MTSKKQNGFNIIEVLVVLIIFGILVKMLAPVFSNYIIKSNRSDAIRSISATQVNEERWRLSNTTYTNTIANVSPTGTSASIGTFYTLAITPASATATAYTITATAGTAQSTDTGGCTTMTLAYTNGTTTKTPATCWQ